MENTEKRRNRSRKRDDILSALRASETHPSAEQLYTALKSSIPDLSIGTVYRNLDLFVREGQAVSVGIVKGQERFDARTEEHAHFICECCGAVVDIDDVPESSAGAELEQRYGVKVKSKIVEYHGLCRSCLADKG